MSRELSPAALCQLLGVDLTEEQLAAVTAPLGPTVVVAGAGSGKTTVMSARVVWLVATGEVTPEQVLGLTFTTKAAAELGHRVTAALATARAAAGATPADDEDLTPTVTTYHSYAAGLVREHGVLLGLEPGARLLTEVAAFQLAERVVRRGAAHLTSLTSGVSTVAGRVLRLESELNEHLVAPDDVRAFDAAMVAEVEQARQRRGRLTKKPRELAAAAVERDELLELVVAYRAEKRRLDLVDFGDQMAGAARLAAQVPHVGIRERERFAVVLLDEYQDTSITQKELLLSLFGAGHPVTAVGDPFQAIYGWRGASVRNIGRFVEEFAATHSPVRSFTLGRNNRSGERILDLANRIADPLRARHPQVATLSPRPDYTGAGEVVCGLHLTRADEVEWVVSDIVAQLAAGRRPRDVAVLSRAGRASAAYAQALTAADVPVEVVGLGGLLALPEVSDLVSMLEVLDDPTANPAALRLLTGPRWRIGPRDLALLGRRAQELVSRPSAGGDGPGDEDDREAAPDPDDIEAALLDAVAGGDASEVVSLVEAVADPGGLPYSPQARERFLAVARELAELRRHRGEPLTDLVLRVLAVTGLDVEVSASPHARRARRQDNLAVFLDEVAAFGAVDGEGGLSAFLAYLRAADQSRGLDGAAPSGADSVKLMTVHKAKGLEWDVVYVPDLYQGGFPSTRSRAVWTARAEVLPFPLRGDADDFPGVPDLDGNKGVEALAGEVSALALDEERRLGYVAVTRARHRLVLSSHWWGPTQKTPRPPGEFLQAAREHCLSGAGEVACWAERPAEERNPALADTPSISWPRPVAPDTSAALASAAAAVRAAAGQPGTSTDMSAEWAAVVEGWDADLSVLVADVLEEQVTDRTVALPTTLSATQLVRLATDRAGLARDLARPLPRPPAPAAARGTRFHTWVETLVGQEALIDLDDLGGAADADWGESDLDELKQAFLAGPYAGRRPVAVEAPFQVVLAGHTVRGRIDAVYATEDGFAVVDWKTGRRPADIRQLAVYRLAWAELAGVPLSAVAAEFYYVADGRVEAPTDLPDRAQLEALLAAPSA